MALDKLSDLIGDSNGIEIALALRFAPGKQAVRSQHNAIATGVLLQSAPHHQAKLKSRPLPWNPNQRMAKFAIEFLHLAFAIARRGQRDTPVWMKMIDVRKGKKTMQRSVDRRRDRIVAKRAQRIHSHHVIFGGDALVTALQGEQFFLIERGKSGAANAAQ